MELYYIGMDVHSANTNFHAGGDDGKVLRTGKVKTSVEGFMEMVSKIKEKAGTDEIKLIAGMESGNEAFQAVMILRELDVDAHIYHAKEVRDKAKNKRQKNDRQDAKEIYEGVRHGYYRQEVWVPTEDEMEVRWLVSRIRGYVKSKARQVNRAKGALRYWWFQDLTGVKLTTGSSWKKVIGRVKGMDKKTWAENVIWGFDKKEKLVTELNRCCNVWTMSDEAAKELEEELRETIKKLSPDRQKGIEIVDDIFGIGFVSAVAFVIAIGDPKRFKNSGKVKKYFGFVPTENSSGSRNRTGRIDKQGNKAIRALAVELAQQAARESHALHQLYTYILHKKGSKQLAYTVVAAKMLQIIWRILRDKEAFDPGMLGVKYVMMNTLKPSGLIGLKLVAVRERKLKRYLKEHNLTQDYVMDVLDKELAKKRMAEIAMELGETEVNSSQKEA